MMTTPDPAYRAAAGIMLLDARGRVFVAQRLDTALDAWQMPQGGLDPDEDAQAGALRELEEETGIPPRLVTVIARSRGELLYDLPAELAGTLWKGRYRGQRQAWFLLRFHGTDADIDLNTPHPEFRDWKWADPRDLPAMIVPFKADLYRAVLREFADHLGGTA